MSLVIPALFDELDKIATAVEEDERAPVSKQKLKQLAKTIAAYAVPATAGIAAGTLAGHYLGPKLSPNVRTVMGPALTSMGTLGSLALWQLAQKKYDEADK